MDQSPHPPGPYGDPANPGGTGPKKGLIIGLSIGAVLLIAAIVVTLILVLGGDDDDDNGGPGGSASDNRPSVDELTSALTAEGFADESQARCAAEVFYDSDISDEGLQAIADNDDAYQPSSQDEAAANEIEDEVLECIGISGGSDWPEVEEPDFEVPDLEVPDIEVPDFDDPEFDFDN